jgi:hypothetical protein
VVVELKTKVCHSLNESHSYGSLILFVLFLF